MLLHSILPSFPAWLSCMHHVDSIVFFWVCLQILGILSEEGYQIVFLDTPGIIQVRSGQRKQGWEGWGHWGVRNHGRIQCCAGFVAVAGWRQLGTLPFSLDLGSSGYAIVKIPGSQHACALGPPISPHPHTLGQGQRITLQRKRCNIQP